MKCTLIIALLIIFSGCRSDERLESFYLSWVEKNYELLAEVDRIALADGRFERIWSVGRSVQFSTLNDGSKEYVGLPETHEIFNVLPQHSNMLYLINESQMSFGVGVTEECGEFICAIGVAKYRNKTPELCSGETAGNEGAMIISGVWNKKKAV